MWKHFTLLGSYIHTFTDTVVQVMKNLYGCNPLQVYTGDTLPEYIHNRVLVHIQVLLLRCSHKSAMYFSQMNWTINNKINNKLDKIPITSQIHSALTQTSRHIEHFHKNDYKEISLYLIYT